MLWDDIGGCYSAAVDGGVSWYNSKIVIILLAVCRQRCDDIGCSHPAATVAAVRGIDDMTTQAQVAVTSPPPLMHNVAVKKYLWRR